MNAPTDTHTHTCLLVSGGVPTGIQLTCFNTCTVAMAAAATTTHSQALFPVSSHSSSSPTYSYSSSSSLLSSAFLCLSLSASPISPSIVLHLSPLAARSPISHLASDLSIAFSKPSSSPPSNYLNTHPFSFHPFLYLSLSLSLSCCRVLALLKMTSSV